MRRTLMALSVIVILFTAAAVHACPWGDANGDGKINIGDAVYLVSYIFRGGPAPNCPNEVPALSTADVSEITQTTAQCGGTITSDGGATVTARGVCWSTNLTPTVADDKTTDGAGAGSYTSSIIDLTINTLYYVRAYATNSLGTGYGMTMAFTTTPAILPALTTADVSEITETTAECGGTITSDGGIAVTARGVCWSTNPTPTVADYNTIDGTGTGSFTSSISDLSASTSYYVRAYATNSVGTGYGDERSFLTTVTDIDGNIYKTVRIGNQWWMAEDMKVTHYRNGDDIPNVTDSTEWSGFNAGAYCNYNNDVANVATYGRLYNWYAVADSRNIAPAGWHVPSDAEWQALVDYLGGDAVAGGKMKETGITHWFSPNTGATNESGFSAVPGGHRNGMGLFAVMGIAAYYWSSTESDSNFAWNRLLSNSHAGVSLDSNHERTGFSVRCVKD